MEAVVVGKCFESRADFAVVGKAERRIVVLVEKVVVLGKMVAVVFDNCLIPYDYLA